MKFRQKKTPANQNEGKNNFFFGDQFKMKENGIQNGIKNGHKYSGNTS